MQNLIKFNYFTKYINSLKYFGRRVGQSFQHAYFPGGGGPRGSIPPGGKPPGGNAPGGKGTVELLHPRSSEEFSSNYKQFYKLKQLLLPRPGVTVVFSSLDFASTSRS